jgi:hypothetical protein
LLIDNIENDVFYAMIFGSAEGYRECDCPDRLDSFTAEAIEGFDDSLSCFRSKPILSKVARKRISALLPLSMRILVMFHLSIWTVTTMASACGNEIRLTSWEEKVIGI